jgi:hypothetical protein
MATLGSIKENEYLNNWVVKASADNAAATATKAAVAGSTHYITAAAAGFSATATKLLQIKDGATVIVEYPIINGDVIPLAVPIKATAENAVSAVLAASGTGGTVGYVNLFGFTV